MCGRITQEQKEIEKVIQMTENEDRLNRKQFNIGIGDTAFVTNSTGTFDLKFGYNFGGRFLFNARAEGFNNKENALNYTGRLGIHTNPSFKDAFKQNRCLIPVTSFLEGPEKEKLSKPYKVGLNYAPVFMLAGVIGVDEKTFQPAFSIITTWPNEAIKEIIGHHRSPVILDDDSTWRAWLDPQTDIEELLPLLRPVASEDMVITPLDPKYKSAKYYEPY